MKFPMMETRGEGANTQRLLALPSRGPAAAGAEVYMLDEHEFLSPFGIRSLSAVYREHRSS